MQTNAERQRQHRKRNKHLIHATPRIEPDPRSRGELALKARFLKLAAWLLKSGHSQAKLRQNKCAPEILRDWVAYQLLAEKFGRTPTPTEFAIIRKISRHSGRDRIRRLAAMKQAGGPWE